MQNRDKKSQIAVISLDMNRRDEKGYAAFLALSAKDKIDLIRQRITVLCEELKNKAPNALWIIGWREYGITEGIGSRAISDGMRQYLKKQMIDLTRQYPQLLVMAGTVSTHKQFSDLSRLEKIKTYYSDKNIGFGMIHAKEKEDSALSEKAEKYEEIKSHFNKIENVLKKGEKEFNVFRNTAYVFYEGEIITRHDKLAPSKETEDYPFSNAIYQPGKGRNTQSFFQIKHPYSREAILLGLEICRENEFSLLKTTCTEEPEIHFVLSDIKKIDLDTMHGNYLVQFDSIVKPQLISSQPNPSPSVIFYRHDLYANAPLSEPISALYPFEKKVKDLLDEAISHYQTTDRKYYLLENIKNKFLKEAKSPQSHFIYSTLLKDLTKAEGELLKEENTFLSFFSWHFFGENAFRMQAFLSKLRNLVEEQQQINPDYKDICAPYETTSPALLSPPLPTPSPAEKKRK